MIKYLVTTISALLFSVGFMYYLIQQSNFVPIDQNGNYVWINVFVLLFLILIALTCFSSLIIFGIRSLFFKDVSVETQVKKSVKYSIWLVLAIFLVYILHFFHILNFWWGIGILVVVITALFVI